jgi:hypothetical protein
MTIQDLSVLLAAVDIAVKRGAFSILEVGQVGAIAEKLNAFLGEAQKQAEAQAEAQKAEQDAAGEQPAEATADTTQQAA